MDDDHNIKIASIVPHNGYLVDSETGDKVLFYECDPSKNTECSKNMCRCEASEDDGGFGFCSKTVNPEFRKENGSVWYSVLKTPDEGEPYWGREYVNKEDSGK